MFGISAYLICVDPESAPGHSHNNESANCAVCVINILNNESIPDVTNMHVYDLCRLSSAVWDL